MKDGEWLNDNCINMYMAMMAKRELLTVGCADIMQGPLPAVPATHFFSAFLYSKLRQGRLDPADVERWTGAKKFGYDIWRCARLVMPINQGHAHWVCVVVDLEGRRLVYYDSLGGEDRTAVERVAQFVHDYAAKAGHALDVDTWERVYLDMPHQSNGYDCGVFVLKFADYVARGVVMDWAEADMPHFRRLITAEMMAGIIAY